MNLTFDRNVALRGQIDDTVANDVIAQLLFYQMEDAKAPTRLTIESHGGSVTASLAIVDTIKFVKNPVHTICPLEARGTALLILGSGTKGFRSAGSEACLGFARTVVGWKRGEPSEVMAFVEKANQRMIAMFAEWSGRSRQEVAQRMNDETQFTAAGLLHFGLIDKIDA